MDTKTAGEILSCPSEEIEFHERFAIIMRAHTDLEFREGLVKHF